MTKEASWVGQSSAGERHLAELEDVLERITDANIGQLTDSRADVQTFVVDTKVAKADLESQIRRL